MRSVVDGTIATPVKQSGRVWQHIDRVVYNPSKNPLEGGSKNGLPGHGTTPGQFQRGGGPGPAKTGK